MKAHRWFGLSLGALLVSSAFAQGAGAVDEALRQVAQKAIAGSPDVSARLNALRASTNAVDIARAGYLPRVDLDANAGRARDRISTRSPVDDTVSYHGVGVTASQLLWDGYEVRRQVERLGHDKLARWFELVDTTEQVALEAARAHHDVLRQRRLVALAEDNYVQHRYAAEQIGSRVRAGVGRGVDLEQSGARVALAEANLVAETANLHDVTQRYLRIVGELPPASLAQPAPLPAAALPASPGDAMNAAARDSAAVSASIENLRAARAAASAATSAYQPRVEARLRAGAGRNFDGIADQKRDVTGELVLVWNLYNGGADAARVRQGADFVNQAADLRDLACRDVRQVAAIAYNDTRKYAEQVAVLERNVLSIEKARDAYRQQFDIGQRSLLDLLNAENEVYTARRAHANAQADLVVAQLRTLAATQRLTRQLGLARPEDPAAQEAAAWSADADAPSRCPASVAELATTPRSELDSRAQQLLRNAPR
jgi:adhesin transport system outer membrane protein